MTRLTESQARKKLSDHGQEQVLRFWDRLDEDARAGLLDQISGIDMALMDRLIREWVLDEPEPEVFEEIKPVPVILRASHERADAREAWDAGEQALSEGRVGVFLVAGGQGTRLGFPGPKGAYPIGPVSQKPLFEFHAEKIINLQRRYGCVLPWYIMVSEANRDETRAFFGENGYFGLSEGDVQFFVQRMVPCVDDNGLFMLSEPGCLAMNPNGHGGSIPALVENGITEDARSRGIDTLSYFQVDNWAVKVADPYFIGYHVMRGGEMSSKNHRKSEPREAVGVHCLCDGEYRVIEYSELDIYPQLLETDEEGRPVHYAGNPAIHILDTGFVERVNNAFGHFPWHRAHKKIPYVDDEGNTVEPDEPNGYKFETFVFDALRFIRHEPIALEIPRQGEYTPIKQFEGANSVKRAWESQAEYWGGWLEEAGCPVPRDDSGRVSIPVEISPQFALDEGEFLRKCRDREWPPEGEDIAIGKNGEFLR